MLKPYIHYLLCSKVWFSIPFMRLKSTTYLGVFVARIKGDLNFQSFEKAWKSVIDRHSALRTSFVWKRLERMLQVVQKNVDISIEFYDWREKSLGNIETEIDEFVLARRADGFDLSKSPLIKLFLIQIGNDEYEFFWLTHHAILDGWSIPIIFRDLFHFYEVYSNGSSVSLNSTRVYRDYLQWLQNQNLDDARRFWEDELAGFEEPTKLPYDFKSKNGKQGNKFKEIEGKLLETISNELVDFSRMNQVTLSTVIQAAWAFLLGKLTRENDIVFGMTVSGRPAELSGVDEMVGLFINTLPLRIKLSPDIPVTQWLQEIQAKVAAIHQYEYSPLYDIQEWSEIAPGTQLFQSILVFENYPIGEAVQLRNSNFEITKFSSIEETNYPLNIISSPGTPLPIKISFDESIFQLTDIEKLLDQLLQVITNFVRNPEMLLRDVKILSVEDERKMVYEWNNTDVDDSLECCVHELFEQQAERKPNNIAVATTESDYTYLELNKFANQLAHYISKKDLPPETRIGICLERSFEMVAVLLGVLKSGNAYIPLDPKNPFERISYMLDEGDAQLLITDSKLYKHLQPLAIDVLLIDTMADDIKSEPDTNLELAITGSQLVYVLFTSGSTGQPKGVMVEHRSLLNLTLYQKGNYKLSEIDKVLQLLSFSFDAAGEEIYPSLCSGATLVLAPPDVDLTTKPFLDFCRENEISILHLNPSLWHVMVSDLEEGAGTIPEEIRITVVGGESPSFERLQSWRELTKAVRPLEETVFINTYGPTEATITATDFKILSDTKFIDQQIPIGKPINNTKVYVLDQFGHPVPVGVSGELFISGVGLSRGYINKPNLSEEKFLDNEFVPGTKMYRTGDLVRYLPDGNIEFLGRIDNQVKIRGYRIELSEIESALLSEPTIHTGVAVVKGANLDKRIIAYVVPKNGNDIDVDNVKKYLGSKIPGYMIPSLLVQIDALPTLNSGKIDYKNLPDPEFNVDKEEADKAPKNPIEELLISIWEKLLGHPNIGVNDNFINLGGHSLLITQLSSKVRDIFQVELPLKTFFEAESLRELAAIIYQEQQQKIGYSPSVIEVQPREGILPLSFAQQRLWFLDQLSPGNLFYNIPVALRFKGEMDVEAFRWSINQIIARHEILRTRFDSVSGKPVQIIEDQLEVEIPFVDLIEIPESERFDQVIQLLTAEANKPFELSLLPLMRVLFVRTNEDEHFFLLTIHHIITDGWSVNLMVKELVRLYEIRILADTTSDISSDLPPLPIQYADFTLWQRKWLEGDNLSLQLDYWRNKLNGRPHLLNLPTDYPRPPLQSSNGGAINFEIDKETFDSLRTVSIANNVTLFITLLASFQILLAKYSGQEDILVGTPIANRNRSELEQLLGFFVNTLVVRSNITAEQSVSQLLKQVRETAIEAYAHQDLPFELLVESIQPERDLSHSPIFQAAFSLQTMPSQILEIPGLIIEPVELESLTSKFDLTMVMAETDSGLSGTLEFSTDLFEQRTIEKMVEHWKVLLESVARNDEELVSNINILTDDEKTTILHDWNQTYAQTPINFCAHELFEFQAQHNPNVVALSFDGRELTYEELNKKSNQLANFLIDLGIADNDLVGISTLRSIEMVIGVLAVMKAGGAYLPLDPTYPSDRLEFMVSDSHISYLLSQRVLETQIPKSNARIIWLDADWDKISEFPDTQPDVKVSPDDLAYVIYTSGSTGKPKGTLLNHRGLSNLTGAQKTAFNVRIGSKILQFSPYSFDASVWEMFMALANGATLCIVKQEILSSPDDLFTAIEQEKITNITLPPSVLRVMPKGDLPDLETIIAAGEACTPDLVEHWAEGRQFVNAYGPTETTVCASMYMCSPEDESAPPIGKPIANTKLYILDNNLLPVPVGVPGELHVSGVSLARGYLNRPEVTRQKFIHNPYSPGERMYKTGDLVKYRADGNIEFLGRIDQQVKVRGFRIELGEIENTINQHDAVKESVVVVREDQGEDKRIVVYIVLNEGSELSVNEVKSFARQYLPEYMVPAAVLFLDMFPLSPSGKVDRNLLPAPDDINFGVQAEYIAPRNDQEEELAAICSELLGIEKVGINDNFFEMGGHSLLATQFISRTRETFDVEIPLRSLFEYPTIAGLSEQISLLKTPEETEDERIQRLLSQIDQMDEDEILTLLEEKRRNLSERNLKE